MTLFNPPFIGRDFPKSRVLVIRLPLGRRFP